jgi:hypothetical protein
MLLVALTRTQLANAVGKIPRILMMVVVEDIVHADTHIHSDYESTGTISFKRI